jgi:tetrahydrodipicolinate N-succinyltransferase
MGTPKYLGIWMDHSVAHLNEFTSHPDDLKTVESKLTHQVKEETLSRSEALMYNKEQHEQADYYKHLEDIIENYTDVVLFGPTEAKSELYNILRADNRFAKIKIEVRDADKMAEGQQHEFVRKYFSGS